MLKVMLLLRVLILGFNTAFLLVVVLATLTVIALYQGFRYLCGRRYRDQGIACEQCHATAFPIDGTHRFYRCWDCGSRFQGLEHF
jgi:hypothetical protein